MSRSPANRLGRQDPTEPVHLSVPLKARSARKAAVERLVRTTRSAQGLPATVTDVEVLERVAALIEGVGDRAQAS